MPRRLKSLRQLTFAALAFFVLRAPSAAAANVFQILSPGELSAKGEGDCPARGARFRIDSQDGEGALAYTEVLEAECNNAKSWNARFRLIAQEERGLVRPGDLLIAENQGGGFPGRNDLVLRGPNRSARYKPLTYLGLIGETAETLDKGELLVDITSRVFFGATDRLNLSTVAVAALGYPNLGMKYRAWTRPWSTLSVGANLVGTRYGAEEGLHLYSAGVSLYYDSKSNTKSTSHTVITLATPPELFRKVTQPGDVLGSLTSSIRTGEQHIFDNWDRLLYGPQYMFETRSVGGYIAYVFVWDTFHLSLNLNVYDITKLKLGVDGYVPHIFGFWRF